MHCAAGGSAALPAFPSPVVQQLGSWKPWELSDIPKVVKHTSVPELLIFCKGVLSMEAGRMPRPKISLIYNSK